MLKITKKEIEIDESLRRKMDFICRSNHNKPKYINGSITKVDRILCSLKNRKNYITFGLFYFINGVTTKKNLVLYKFFKNDISYFIKGFK